LFFPLKASARTSKQLPEEAPVPYTAKEAAAFVRMGACMVAWPPGEVWVDPFREEGEKGVESSEREEKE
jgi:hypothetical protein